MQVTQERLFVNASSPFMRERENTGLIVRPGSLTLISATNLTVDTNLNMDPRAITYEVLNSTRVWLMLDTDKVGDVLMNVLIINSRRMGDDRRDCSRNMILIIHTLCTWMI